MDILGLPTVLVPPDPGNVSAFGLLTVDVQERLRAHLRSPATTRWTSRRVAAIFDELSGQARDALLREGFAGGEHVFVRTRRPALLRPGLRGPGAVPGGRGRRGRGRTA